MEAKVMVLPRSPDEALIVDIARGLNGCDVIKQADSILVKTAGCLHYQAQAHHLFFSSHASIWLNHRYLDKTKVCASNRLCKFAC